MRTQPGLKRLHNQFLPDYTSLDQVSPEGFHVTMAEMYAELVVNVEAPLAGTFHYHVPADLAEQVRVGQLVEVEFGRILAQGIIITLADSAPIAETKPLIALVDETPVVYPWQIELARWLSSAYVTPLNACLRLMLPPGLTRWADMTLDIHPQWAGQGRLTPLQERIIALLREKGDLRGRKLAAQLPRAERERWKSAVAQLVGRGILRRGSVLDSPRIRPKILRTAELLTDPHKIRDAVVQLGRANKQADILNYLAVGDDPLPATATVLAATGATRAHLEKLAAQGLVQIISAETVDIPADDHTRQVIQPESVGLAIPPRDVLGHILEWRGAGVYHRLLTYLARAAQPAPLNELYAATGIDLPRLRRLEKMGLIRFGAEEVWRDPLADRDFVPAVAPLLTHDQARVWGRVKMVLLEQEDHTAGPQPILLHGVTGSGKTEIYMRAIDHALQAGQRAIVLVPEIALTPQTVRRFAARFPGRVAILHSHLSDGERYDTWRRARAGLIDILIGPRSALFAPLDKLGVIVVDEEHDDSYKQTAPVPPPYYHARDAAITLGRLTGALVIMGSATPDVVTYHRARGERYQLLELPKRVMGHRERIEDQAQRLGRPTAYTAAATDPRDALTIPLPPIQLVDLRQELRAGNRSVFSRALQQALDEVLARREQAILFLNRRGTATFVLCRDCGHILACPNCDTPLTYHRPKLALICHYCGHKEPPSVACPQCGSRRIKHFGLGTEELEFLVQARWPQARIVRWDSDTTAGRDKHEELLASFVNQQADVLVGTQMIAKGLDLPLVTLVGVISADTSLGLPDYRTGERTFQLLTQVAGRAGRGLLGGRVIVQTYRPEHYAIQAAAEHDYTTFYLNEIRFRTQHGHPPFRRLVKLLFEDAGSDRAEQSARELAAALRAHVRAQSLSATDIIGPTPPFFGRIDRRFRWQLLARTPDPARLLADFPLPAGCQLDIDPVSTL